MGCSGIWHHHSLPESGQLGCLYDPARVRRTHRATCALIQIPESSVVPLMVMLHDGYGPRRVEIPTRARRVAALGAVTQTTARPVVFLMALSHRRGGCRWAAAPIEAVWLAAAGTVVSTDGTGVGCGGCNGVVSHGAPPCSASHQPR